MGYLEYLEDIKTFMASKGLLQSALLLYMDPYDAARFALLTQ